MKSRYGGSVAYTDGWKASNGFIHNRSLTVFFYDFDEFAYDKHHGNGIVSYIKYD